MPIDLYHLTFFYMLMRENFQVCTLTSPTLTHSPLTAFSHYPSHWWSANNMLLDFTNIAQSNIPISTAAPTHHVSIFNTSPIFFFKKKIFKNFLDPFWGPRGSCPLFSNSSSPAAYPYIFSDVSTFFSLPSSRYSTS